MGTFFSARSGLACFQLAWPSVLPFLKNYFLNKYLLYMHVLGIILSEARPI